MSYYGIHHINIDTITCIHCGTETFSWLADTFACPECGRNFDEADHSDGDSDTSTLVGDEDKRADRKRKRDEGSEGDGR
jgi:tRNA(Ile2) C34 agmatinyltransferase TiaS